VPSNQNEISPRILLIVVGVGLLVALVGPAGWTFYAGSFAFTA
jgi:hypothetical protein